MLWLTFTLSAEPALVPLLVGTVLVGVSAGTGFSQLVGAALRDIPAERYAMATAGRTTFFQLSVAFAIALAFTVIGQPVDTARELEAYRTTWMICAGAYSCNLVLFGIVYPRRRFALRRSTRRPVESRP